MMKRSFRFQDELMEAIKDTAKKRGYKSTNAFMVEAAQNEIERGNSAMRESEKRVSAVIDTVYREIRKLNEGQQVQIAFQEAIIKFLLTCIPEPPEGGVLEKNRATARVRYERVLQSITHSLNSGNLKSTIAELITDAERAGS
jgi:hypothetical protein